MCSVIQGKSMCNDKKEGSHHSGKQRSKMQKFWYYKCDSAASIPWILTFPFGFDSLRYPVISIINSFIYLQAKVLDPEIGLYNQSDCCCSSILWLLWRAFGQVSVALGPIQIITAKMWAITRIKTTMSYTSHQWEWPSLTSLQIINVGEDVEKRESSYTLGGDVNSCSHYGKQYEGSSKQ